MLLLALLAVGTYAPTLGIPLIEDDYPNLSQAQVYGSPSGLGTLFGDPVFRLRATSYWVMNILWRMAGLNAPVYHVASLLLHIACVLLVYRMAAAWTPMRGAAPWAAAFFAVHEGHQEAVMWFSAINELLMFAFGMAALLCWIKEKHWTGAAFFAFALLSKESAVIFMPFFLLTRRSNWKQLLPYWILGALAIMSIWSGRHESFRFTDGSFSLDAPFWLTWPKSMARILWIWGFLAAFVTFWPGREKQREALLALAWIGIALVPYSFLTYMTQIPSRQTYLAGAGVAFLFGLAMASLPDRRGLVAVVMTVMILHNAGYIWVRKQRQFRERAAPTEQLIELARKTSGPIWIRCFPRGKDVAQEAVRLATGRAASDLVWSEADGKPTAVFCYPQR